MFVASPRCVGLDPSEGTASIIILILFVLVYCVALGSTRVRVLQGKCFYRECSSSRVALGTTRVRVLQDSQYVGEASHSNGGCVGLDPSEGTARNVSVNVPPVGDPVALGSTRVR